MHTSPTSTSLRSYLEFLADHRRLVGFGLLTATLSGFGQTFFVGLFNNQLRTFFDLSHGGFGLMYGAATLVSAGLLTYMGRLYDRTDLRIFLTGAALTLAAGCGLLAGARSIWLLFPALLLLRHGGQGLMGHIALTTMARRFYAGRGKAVGVAALGFSVAEAIFPAVAVALLAVVDWRTVWWLGAAAVLVIFVPLLQWLLRGSSEEGEEPASEGTREQDWNLRQALTDTRFMLIVPAAIAAPFVVTVAFFHQVPIAMSKGWSLDLLALGLSMFAIGHVLGNLASGPIVDRISAARALTPALLPMVGSLAVLAILEAPGAALVWPGLMGVTMGLTQTASSALLAELYGSTHLGGIRAMLQALMVFSTAVGPPLIGWLLDLGTGIEPLALGMGIAVCLAGVLAWLGVGRTAAGAALRPLESSSSD